MSGPVPSSTPQELTQLLNAARSGDTKAAEVAWLTIYGDVRDMAARACAGEGRRSVLQPTLVVNELFLKMFGPQVSVATWDDRRHFWGSVMRAISQYLVDVGRSESAQKRGGLHARVQLEVVAGELADAGTAMSDAARAAVEALDRLEAVHPAAAQVARLRYLSGLTIEQTADILDISPRSVANYWSFARLWLLRELHAEDGGAAE